MNVHGIGIKRVKREPLIPVEKVLVSLEDGMISDVRGKGGRNRKRQVTVLSIDQWRSVCSVMGWNPREYSWMLRRAGLCLEGVWLDPSHIGQHILINNGVALKITGETEPCERMNEIHPGLKDVLAEQMRGGVTCTVVMDGMIRIGDHVEIRHMNPL